MTSRINITTQVNINGVNADTYSDATLFAMIQQQEAEVKNLLSITNKPQSLLAEIAARQAGISAGGLHGRTRSQAQPTAPTARQAHRPRPAKLAGQYLKSRLTAQPPGP
jgi:hypothetical protein